ncbi:MAG: hypothetical protein M3356_05910 [Actinomycetota bacterium]|nr:hypothetical protein [Actinomycetota bacterium]
MTTRNRSLMFLAIVATLALALIGAGCGGDDGGGSSDEDARALLEKAFTTQVDSGDIALDLKAELDGAEELKGPLSLTLSGPFKSEGPKDLPILDWDIVAEGAGQKFDVGLTVTNDNAFVEFQGEAYEAGTQLFSQFKQQYAAQQPNGQLTLKSFGLDPATWLEDPEVEDGDEIGGDSTQVVSGTVDVEKVVRDFYSLTKSDAFRQQLERQGQTIPEIPEPSDEDIQKIEDAIDELTLEVNVDENDVARRLSLEGDFTVPEDAGDGEVKGGSVSFGYTLEEVGIDPQIEGPANAKPLTELIQQFGPLLGGGLPQPQTTP